VAKFIMPLGVFGRTIECAWHLRRKPGNRRPSDIVALRQLLQRRALGPAFSGLGLLLRGEGRGSAHVLPAGFGPAPAFGRPGADQVALHVGQAA
jgi:hypothetical protein